jgi:hypothetical protein
MIIKTYVVGEKYISWKESLNSDCQPFHQYQQNKQLPLTSNDLTQKRPRHMALEIGGPEKII